MNKKGITIIELLVSMTIISLVMIFLARLMFMLMNVTNDTTYASDDEIRRTTIIKNIENDFLKNKLNGLDITKTNHETTINLNYAKESSTLKITSKELTYNNTTYPLESKNATYDLCPIYSYLELDPNYYLVTITIPVLINNENTTLNDDLTFSYLSAKTNSDNYPKNYVCSK